MYMKPECCASKKKDDLSTISHSRGAGWWRSMSIPVYSTPREEAEEISHDELKEALGLTETSTSSSTSDERSWTN